MKAIILAAGYGNRMKPLTDRVHKTLLKIGDRTIIERLVDSLLENGVRTITIVTGYMARELKDYLSSRYPELNIQFVHNSRFAETNNIYSLSLAINAIDLDDDILLIESDLVYDPSVILRLTQTKYPNAALLDKYRSGMDGTVVTVSKEVITNIIPPHLQGDNFDFSDKYKTLNIYKFSKEFCRTTFKQLLIYYASAIDDNCYYEYILGMLIYMQKETIHAEILNGEKWTEVDDPNDLWLAEYTFSKDKKFEILNSTFGGYWNHNILDFYFIRNMYFPTHSMMAEMKNNLPRLIQNYGSRQDVLNQKLAYYLLCAKENVQVLNGSSQAYPLMNEYFVNQRALIPEPTFGEYPRIFKNCGIYPDKVGMDTDEIEARMKDYQVIVFVNPNNPTGSAIPTNWIFELARRYPDKTIIVDESFIEFSVYPSLIGFLEERSLMNVIVVKSLSKSLGIPGLRLGYVYSMKKDFNQFVQNRIPIWNLNSMTEYFLEIILKHRTSLKESFAQTVRDRKCFSNSLSELRFVKKVYPSAANFLLVALDKDWPGVITLTKELLEKYSIYAKDVSEKLDSQYVYLRLAVRLPEENDFLISCLKQYLDEKKASKFFHRKKNLDEMLKMS